MKDKIGHFLMVPSTGINPIYSFKYQGNEKKTLAFPSNPVSTEAICVGNFSEYGILNLETVSNWYRDKKKIHCVT